MNAQGGMAWGVKGGLTTGFQQWNSFQRNPLYRYHGDLYVESYDGPDANSLYAQLGYHVKGSALRNRNGIDISTGNPFRLPTFTFEFYNISLATGFKQRFDFNDNKAYYMIGIRGDYTLDTNLADFDDVTQVNRLFFPLNGFVTRWNYGLSGGAGLEFMFSNLVGGFIEFSIAPDLSFQYRQPAIPNVYDPFTGNERTLPERRIRNLALELTVGIRLLRIVEYVD